MKMKGLFILLLIGACCTRALAQKELKYAMVQDRQTNRYVVIDTGGKVLADSVLKPSGALPYPWRYNEGIFNFRGLGGKIGYKDVHNNTVLPAAYNELSDFIDGAGIVRNSIDRWGVVNRKGEWVLPPVYAAITRADTNGTLLVTTPEGLVGLITSKGEIILKPSYRPFKMPAGFSDGLLAVCHWNPLSEKPFDSYLFRDVGFINLKGALVIDTTWKADSATWKGTAIESMRIWDGTRDDSKTIVVHDYYRFEKGKALVRKEGRNVVINKKGQMLYTLPDSLENIYNVGGLFSFTNKAKAASHDQKMVYGLFGPRGVVWQGAYPTGAGFRNGYLLIKENDTSHFYLDSLGHRAFGGRTFRYAGLFREGFAQVTLASEGTWSEGLITTKGELKTMDSALFVNSTPSDNGWFLVFRKEGWGFVDARNKIRIPTVYKYLGNFSNGYCGFYIKDETWGYLDERNQIVLPAQYGEVLPFQVLTEE